MSDTLKIMVRTEGRRSLTREEAYALEAAKNGHRVSEDARTFLANLGIIHSTYLSAGKASQWGNYGSAKFLSPLREATVDEIDAYLHLEKLRVCSKKRAIIGQSEEGVGDLRFTCKVEGCMFGCSSTNERRNKAKEILQDKEIILEVVKGGDAHDD